MAFKYFDRQGGRPLDAGSGYEMILRAITEGTRGLSESMQRTTSNITGNLQARAKNRLTERRLDQLDTENVQNALLEGAMRRMNQESADAMGMGDAEAYLNVPGSFGQTRINRMGVDRRAQEAQARHAADREAELADDRFTAQQAVDAGVISEAKKAELLIGQEMGLHSAEIAALKKPTKEALKRRGRQTFLDAEVKRFEKGIKEIKDPELREAAYMELELYKALGVDATPSKLKSASMKVDSLVNENLSVTERTAYKDTGYAELERRGFESRSDQAQGPVMPGGLVRLGAQGGEAQQPQGQQPQVQLGAEGIAQGGDPLDTLLVRVLAGEDPQTVADELKVDLEALERDDPEMLAELLKAMAGGK